MTCALCNSEADCIGKPPVCDECGGQVALMYMGEFAKMRGELEREKVACANVTVRLAKAMEVHEDRVAGLISEHQLVESDLNGRIGRTLLHLTSLRYWPFKRVVENVIRILDGTNDG